MLEGIAFLAIVTAAITSTFVARAAHEERETAQAAESDAAVGRLEARLDGIAQRLQGLEDIAQRLDRLERLLRN